MWRAGIIRLARLRNIAVEVHISIGLVILVGAWGGWTLYGGVWGSAYGILAVCLLFGCLLLHELAHGALARQQGLAINRIRFLPVGILLEVPPASPRQEMLIALVGPLANLGAGLVLGVLAYLSLPQAAPSLGRFLEPLLTPGITGILIYLTVINIFLGLFNMLPAFPMDGGRVLRAGLALHVDYGVATRIAAWIGRGLAVIMGLTGLIAFPLAGLPLEPALVIVAVIVFVGAQHEELYVRQQQSLVYLEVRDVYEQAPETISPWNVVTRPLIVRLFKHEQILPVVVEDRVVGLLTYEETKKSLEQDDTVTVAHVMRTDFPVLQLQDTLWVALRVMNDCQLTKLPVVQDDVFQGVVSLEDIDRAWRILPSRRRDGSRPLISGDTSQ